ncbi:MAG: tRNA 2-thiouridine(34) synthase MnmA [Candidatus Pacebacteria bacterium]|nr:tRNA 2-thiouridine(34) synthase MnmA [Candidatus Paceibacterota bacterium]
MSKNIKGQKIVVGMSGGVDSSVALILLKQKGWQPIGLSLELPIWDDKTKPSKKNTRLLKKQSPEAAAKVCKKLNIPHYIVDAKKDFEKQVVKYFIDEWKNLRTPNPCVICNPNFKFKQLIAWAKKHKVEYIATGHYARLKFNFKTKQYELLKARDKNKDQTYHLCFLPQKWLKHIIFPLGSYTKEEIYQIAKKQGLKFFDKKEESKDFCFIAGQSLCPFLKQEIGKKQGLIVDSRGNILSQHQGLHFFTIGQRKGIKLSGGPYFVVGFDKKKNALLVTKNKKDLFKKEIFVFPYHFISERKLLKPFKGRVSIRYQQKPVSAIITPKKRELKIVFSKPVFAPCPGQFAVFYQRDKCLGGGKII